LPVKKGWQAEQISTEKLSPFVDAVSITLPQEAQVTLVLKYFG